MESKTKGNMELEVPSSKKQKCSEESRINIHEDLCLRFPSVAELIFDELDN